MNLQDQNVLFQPVITACLTNAVYSCQLLNPDMKNNPEAALQNVLLTYHRIIELMSKQAIDTALANVQLGQFVLLLIQRTKERIQAFPLLSVMTDYQKQEKYMLDGQMKLLVEISEYLKKTQEK